MKYLSTLALILLLVVNAFGQQIATWNFGTISGSASPSNGVPVSHLTISDVAQGNNYGVTTMLTTTSPSSGYIGASGAYNAAAAADVGSLNTGLSGSAYFEFTLTPDVGYVVTLSSVSFATRSTLTGPQTFTLRCSSDSYVSDLFPPGSISNNSTWTFESSSGLNVTSSPSTAITFRIYGYNGTGSVVHNKTNWQIDDLSLTISATHDAPLPVTVKGTMARDEGGVVHLSILTATEIDIVGFNISRSSSKDGPFELVSSYTSNAALKTSSSSTSGGSYSFVDYKVLAGKTYYYKIESVSTSGISKQVGGILDVLVTAPKFYGLYQNYPNPFNPSTTITFDVPKTSQVVITIYDVLGRQVETLVNEEKNAGEYKFIFNGDKYASGIYFCKMVAGNYSSVKKLILAK